MHLHVRFCFRPQESVLPHTSCTRRIDVTCVWQGLCDGECPGQHVLVHATYSTRTCACGHVTKQGGVCARYRWAGKSCLPPARNTHDGVECLGWVQSHHTQSQGTPPVCTGACGRPQTDSPYRNSREYLLGARSPHTHTRYMHAHTAREEENQT